MRACWRETDRARRGDVSKGLATVLLRGTKRKTRFRMVPIVSPAQQSLLAYAIEHARGAHPMPRHQQTVRPSGLRSPLGLGCSSELKCLGPESNQRHGDFQAAFRNGQGREIPAEDGPRGGAL